MKPLVSVIILSFNQSKYIEDAIESVFKQTFHNWELIIIDNGSNDGTQQLLKKYADNPKVRTVLHTTNESICKRSNEGVRLASGDYISFLYSDDYYLPEKLEKQVKCFESLTGEWGVVCSPGYDLNVFTRVQKLQSCIKTSGYILEDFLTRFHEGFINPISPLVRKECFERYPFHEDQFTEGEGIYLRVAMKYKFYYLDESLVVMREHDRNARFASKQNVLMTQAVFDKLAVHPDFPKRYLPYLRRLRARLLRTYGWQDLRFGSDIAWTRKMFYLSVSADWKQLLHPRTIVGWTLSYLPRYMRSKFNNLVNKVTKRGKVIYLDDYYRG